LGQGRDRKELQLVPGMVEEVRVDQNSPMEAVLR
jgi:hypothetical protein